jgi:outer membrane protein TolC
VSNAVAASERVRNELSGNAAAALGRYLSARQAVDRYGRINARAQELYAEGERLKQQGEVDLLRVLLGQRTLFESNLDYIGAQERLWTAAAEVAGLLQSEQFP